MKTPECPGRGDCGRCPFAKACRGEAAASVKPTIGKIIDFQTRQIISTYSAGFSGGPIPKENTGCTCGLRGTCPQCKKAA